MRLRTLTRLLNPATFGVRTGRCAVCGRRALFILIDRMETIRNHALCIWCKSASRNRHIAYWICREMAPKGIRRLSDFAKAPDIRVLIASSANAVAKAFGAGPNIVRSEFFDDVAPGALKGGVVNQDLRRLTFADASLDLVVTEDVFEHIAEYRDGFKEVHRVLKKGGLHVFSIPFYYDAPTRDLFRMEGGKPVLLEPIEYHGDPVRGEIPCFVHFGYDLFRLHEELGFELRVEWARYADVRRYGVFDCSTFIARKK